MKQLILLCVVAALCSGCAIGAGAAATSLLSGYSCSLTASAEKELIDRACKEFEMRQLEKTQQQ